MISIDALGASILDGTFVVPEMCAMCTIDVCSVQTADNRPTGVPTSVREVDIRGMNDATPLTTATKKTKKVTPLTVEQSAFAAKMLVDPECVYVIDALSAKYLRPGFDLEDLKQISRVNGILKAVVEWDPEGGLSFKNFAALRIKNALRIATKMVRTADAVDTDTERDILCDAYSMDAAIDDGDSLHDILGESNDFEEEYAREEEGARVREAIASLNANDQQMLPLVADGLSDYEISDKIGVARKTVAQRRWYATKRLAEALGVEPPVAPATIIRHKQDHATSDRMAA